MEESRWFFSCRYSSLHRCCRVMKRRIYRCSLGSLPSAAIIRVPIRDTRAIRPRGIPCASQVGNPHAQGLARAFCATSCVTEVRIDYRGDSRASSRLLKFLAISVHSSIFRLCTVALLAIRSRVFPQHVSLE